jgi:hypothetical protein
VAIVAAVYVGYALVRLVVRASRKAAVAHAAQLWRTEQRLHLDIEPSLNHLAAAHPLLAQTTGYYYGLLHFIVTPLVLAWLYLRRPTAFGRLRSALVLATTAANLVFWTWPVAPPRFSVPGMADVLVRYHILSAGNPRGPDSLVNLYAAMPSLHVAWAAWCAAAIVTATRTRWRHLAWLYPAATTLVVLASANHFLLDAAAGLAITTLGMLATRATTRPDTAEPAEPGLVPERRRAVKHVIPDAAGAGQGPAAATRTPRPAAWWRRAARQWAWAVTECAAMLIALRAPAVSADVRAAPAHGLRLPWLGAAAAAAVAWMAGLVAAQRQLLPARAVAATVFASTGLPRLLPAGPATAAARRLARHAGRSRWRWRLATGLAWPARHRLGPRRGAAVLAASGLSVLGEAGLLAAAFEVARTPVPWRGLLLACAAGQLGGRLVPLPGRLGGAGGACSARWRSPAPTPPPR